MQIDLNDQVALVTGGAHRVGKAIALELARCGVNILINYSSTPEDVARNTVQELKSFGVKAHAVQADISTPEGVEAVFEVIRERYGRLNILVNSASVFPKGTLLETTYEEWQRALDVNLTGPFLCTQAAAKMMHENDPSGGAIINICDKGSISPWQERAAHGVSKAGLWMLTQTAAVNFAPDIRVNGVLPGPVMKPPKGLSDDQWNAIGRDTTLLQTTGNAEDVARAVSYLARESYITGALIHVNGGEHLR
jgi:NAD(P)-dependent dehydrogenase (short-subunit alcohol dehydrogenase family)